MDAVGLVVGILGLLFGGYEAWRARAADGRIKRLEKFLLERLERTSDSPVPELEARLGRVRATPRLDEGDPYQQMLRTLTERERLILALLGDDSEMTDSEVAEAVGVSTQDVKDVLASAMSTFRELYDAHMAERGLY